MSLDLVFRGATIVDGTGAEARPADLGIADGRIVAVGSVPSTTDAARVVEATGLGIAPGFVDIHTHSDVSLLRDPAAASKVRQGVTTEVVGNCGFSAFPVAPERLDLHHEHLAGIEQDPARPHWTDLAGYASALESGGVALNVATLVGHGCLRIAGMGMADRAPTADEFDRMRTLLETALAQGAFGLSTGLTYLPSMYGSTDEIVQLSKVVGRNNGVYATHARVTADLLDSVDEAIEIGRRAGVRVQYSHAAINNPNDWGRAPEVVEAFRRGRSEGVDVAYDVYPYDASSSALTQYLPAWVQAGGVSAMVARLRDASMRRRAVEDIAAGWFGGIPWLWERVLVSRCDDAGLVGRNFAELAEAEGARPADLMLRLCERYGNEVKVVLFYRTEEDMLTFLADPLASVGSDGNAVPFELPAGDRPHPRFFGSFPRVLGRYVRDRAALSLPDAVRKLTSVPAERLGLRDRGRLAEGLAADVVAFRADTVIDKATFLNPCQPPLGIDYVVVNGRLVVDQGHQTNELPGVVLRRT